VLHERTVGLPATVTLMAAATVLLITLPANAAPVPYNVEIETGSGKLEGTVTTEPDAIWWDLELEDTNKEDDACVYARIVVDRAASPDNVFKSKEACFGEPVRFTDKDPGTHKGFTLDFCSDQPDAAPECIRVPSRLFPRE
jgi:hypothetical protein